MITRSEFIKKCQEGRGTPEKGHKCEIGGLDVYWIQEGKGVSIVDSETSGDRVDIIEHGVTEIDIDRVSERLDVHSKSDGDHRKDSIGLSLTL